MLFEELKAEWPKDPNGFWRCEICGVPLMELYPHNFMHVLPKKNYESFRLRKKNIVCGCFACHRLADHYTDVARASSDSFKWFFDLQDRLRLQYNRLFNSNILWFIGRPDVKGGRSKRIQYRVGNNNH